MTSKANVNFVLFFSLHQLMKAQTCITCNSAQQSIIDVGFSDYQLIFCTRTIYRIKRGTHRHIRFRSFKHYSADLFKETLTNINFPN